MSKLDLKELEKAAGGLLAGINIDDMSAAKPLIEKYIADFKAKGYSLEEALAAAKPVLASYNIDLAQIESLARSMW